MTAYVDLTHLQANAPESGKRGLEPIRGKRANMLMRFANEIGADTITTNESGSFLMAAAARRRNWVASYPPPNERINGHRRGNGFLAKRQWVIAERSRLACPRTGPGGPLNLPVRLITRDGATVAVIGFHAQTRGADPGNQSRVAMTRKIRAYIDQLDAAGIPVIVAGDANDGNWHRNFPNLKVAAHHGVDWVLVSPSIKVRGSRTHRLPKVSDHHFISADLAIPVTDTNKRLPAVKE